MKVEDVPAHWTDVARSAYETAWGQGYPPYRSMMHALAAVAPLIAKAERERCAKVAEQEGKDFADPAYAGGPMGAFSEIFACKHVATAIRALPDA